MMIRRCISILAVFLLLAGIIPTTASAVSLTNLALNKAAKTGSGSYCSGSQTAAQAVDGSTSTKWCVSGADWLRVDLGATYNVREFVLTNAGSESAAYITRDYDISTSTDGDTWTNAVTVTNNTYNVVTNTITEVAARYVKLNVTAPTQSGGGVIRIYEFAVNGDPTVVDAGSPSINTQPAGTAVNEGDSSPTLSVAASISDGGSLSYQWYSNTINSNSGGTAIGGAISASYAAPTSTAGTTYYYVVATNTNTGATNNQTATTTSSAAAVTVKALVDAATPIISTQPADAAVNKGDTGPTLNVAAGVSDGGTLSYQWYSNTINSNNGGTAINGATSASYSAPTNAVGATYYYVVATNTNAGATGSKTAAATSSAARVIVNEVAPLAPTNLTAAAGDGQVTLHWDRVSGAVTYDVYAGTASGAYGSTPIAIVADPSGSYTATGLTNGATYYYAVRAGNAGGTSAYSGEASATPKSGNAKLSNLVLSNGTLSPSFDASASNYAASVAYNVSSVTVTASVYDPAATVVVNGTPVSIGSASEAVSLGVGGNTITVVVTAQNGIATQTYTVKVTRAANIFVMSAQTDDLGQTVQLTFNQPLDPLSIASSAFMLHAGNVPIAATRAVYGTSVSNTVYVTAGEPLYRWDRITVDVHGGVIQSVYGSPLAEVASFQVQNDSAVMSPDFPDSNHIHIGNIIAFLKRRNFDVDADGDGKFDSADIKMLLLHIQSVTQ